MDSLETHDQLAIVNRSTEHRISRKLICKIPYFEKLLSHDSEESKENKFEFDFDEEAFKAILDWVEHHNISLKIDNVINVYQVADYFDLDRVLNECFEFFCSKFSIDYLPVIIPQVTETTKCINHSTLNAFICRYFLKIVNSYIRLGDNSQFFWLEFPLETIEYICALDLMVYSEYQVFDAIMKWVNFDADSRKSYLKELLKLVRWCHLKDKDLSKIRENKMFKSSGFEPIFCSPRKVNCDCIFNRASQNYFVMIKELDFDYNPYKVLLIQVLDNHFKQLFSQVITMKSLQHYEMGFIKKTPAPLDFFPDEHISDVFFNSGRDTLRIDWEKREYKSRPFSFYLELQLHVLKNVGHAVHLVGDTILVDAKKNGYLILEGPESFSLIYLENGVLNYIPRPSDQHKHMQLLSDWKATILDNKIYLLSSKLNLYEFVIEEDILGLTWSHEISNKQFIFNESLLTSSPAGAKVILIDNLAKCYISFDVHTKESSIGYTNFSTSRSPMYFNKLLTFTSAFLPLNTIKTCSSSKI